MMDLSKPCALPTASCTLPTDSFTLTTVDWTKESLLLYGITYELISDLSLELFVWLGVELVLCGIAGMWSSIANSIRGDGNLASHLIIFSFYLFFCEIKM
jgi:hypothetical protein